MQEKSFPFHDIILEIYDVPKIEGKKNIVFIGPQSKG